MKESGSVDMIDLKEFRSRLNTHYMSEFDGFWRWKTETETAKKHILDDNHRDQARSKLWSILRGWQAYRPYDSRACLGVLKDALEKIADSYEQIRPYTLLEFDKISDKPLEVIWHELGRVKESGGRKNKRGHYYIVSLSKHLMFLWGQTPAFDSIVRIGMSRSYNISRNNRWSFEEWKMTLLNVQENLKREPEVIAAFRTASLEKYRTESTVPYGRFLDIYYH